MDDRGFLSGEKEVVVDDEYSQYSDYDLPSFVGSTTFQKLPLCETEEALRSSGAELAIVGAPIDDGASNRPGARFGPRAIRQATYHSGDLWSIQLGTSVLDRVTVVDAGDAPVVASRPDRFRGEPGRDGRGGGVPAV